MNALFTPIEGLPIVFEDDAVLLVNKPSGMLSQPGKTCDGSVLSRVLDSERSLHGPVLVHRLDMDTSGLLILAKTRNIHRSLQQQFEHRMIKKRYKAVLERPVNALGGRIDLPIRLDIDNRPRQIVCPEHGKESTTLWHRNSLENLAAVAFYPLTGRTHQLRVHAASTSGLGNPIKGDRLYGGQCQCKQNPSPDHPVPEQRLMLHAEYLQFEHPLTQCLVGVRCPAPF